VVSAEQNLEEFPLFELKARKRGTKARVFERTVPGEGGVSRNQLWKVMPSGEYGMPGPIDQDVYLAVLQLLQQRGGMPEDGELSFSLYELRKILGWSDDSSGAYKDIRDSLTRIATTSMQSRNAFYSAEEKRRIVDTFNIWSVHFAEHELRGQLVRERHVLRFHPIFIRNYMAQYLKGIDADFYWSLRSPISKRLYRLADLQRAGGLRWKTDLFAVRDQVPLDYPYPSQIKRALQKAHAELLERDFLAGVEYEGKTGVEYRVSRDFVRRQKARELSGDPKEIYAIERLIREGIGGDTARELVVGFGPDRCLLCADAVNIQSGVRGRAGWIVAAIKEGWNLKDPAQATLQEPLPEVPVEASTGTSPPSRSAEEGSRDRKPPEPDPQAQRLWESVLNDLAAGGEDPAFTAWFNGAVPISLEGDILTLAVPNALGRDYIERRFKGEIEASLRRLLSSPTAALGLSL
jgi:hypothetical protein